MSFARPHIETHSRSKGHSAVAGCAYRLGLAMVDERTGRAFDYTRKNGVLWSEHMAPDGAPAWQQNAAQFWNAAEAAEKRKDAQVARDFRIPIPLGFSERDAQELAQRMARTLRDDLAAPVSVALHRDAERDRFGEVKDGTRGFHAHIFTPARGVEPDAMAAKKLGVFLDLGNKNKSGAWVEKWNEAWATHANAIIAERGLSIEQRSHLSYARQGLERPTEWKMGPAAVAMERAGVRTAVGERLRAVHPTPPSMDHAAAQAERERDQAQQRRRQELAVAEAVAKDARREAETLRKQAAAKRAEADQMATTAREHAGRAVTERETAQRRHLRFVASLEAVERWRKAWPIVARFYEPGRVRDERERADEAAKGRDRARSRADAHSYDQKKAERQAKHLRGEADTLAGLADDADQRLSRARRDLEALRQRHRFEAMTPEQQQQQREREAAEKPRGPRPNPMAPGQPLPPRPPTRGPSGPGRSFSR
jgi:MobA/MobL family.